MRSRPCILWLGVVMGLLVGCAPDRDGLLRTYLHSGDMANALKQIQQGANVNARFEGGTTLAMETLTKPNTRALRLLAENGADVDAARDDGKTVLMLAAERGNRAAVQYLIELRVDVTLRDDSGATARSLAEAAGQGAIAALLVEAEAEAVTRPPGS